jgi:transposase
VTILLETGPIERFAQVGNYSSYARCVPTDKISNGKSKGKGNSKNGNRYLAMAFMGKRPGKHTFPIISASIN